MVLEYNENDNKLFINKRNYSVHIFKFEDSKTAVCGRCMDDH